MPLMRPRPVPAPHCHGKDLAVLLARALMASSDAAWDRLRPYGIKRIVERHPTEAAKVVVGEREVAVR